jgi:hypothetical protein
MYTLCVLVEPSLVAVKHTCPGRQVGLGEHTRGHNCLQAHTHSLTHSFTRSLTHSLTQPPTYSLSPASRGCKHLGDHWTPCPRLNLPCEYQQPARLAAICARLHLEMPLHKTPVSIVATLLTTAPCSLLPDSGTPAVCPVPIPGVGTLFGVIAPGADTLAACQNLADMPGDGSKCTLECTSPSYTGEGYDITCTINGWDIQGSCSAGKPSGLQPRLQY